MPYAYDYSKSYKSQIKAYWEAQIDSGYGGNASMKSQLNTYLDNISAAESGYISNENNEDPDDYAAFRLRWSIYFGLINLYVFYKHCIAFPLSANLPQMFDGLIPWPSGDLGGDNDDLRSLALPWRYSWPGDGMTSYPWFSLSPGIVSEIIYAHGAGEATLMKNVFNSRYPVYSSRYTNQAFYNLGSSFYSTTYASISDSNPACADYDRLGITPDQLQNEAYGLVDRMRVALSHNYYHYDRYKIMQKISGYIASGGEFSVIDKPENWMLNHGGQEIIDYFGWSNLSGYIA